MAYIYIYIDSGIYYLEQLKLYKCQNALHKYL